MKIEIKNGYVELNEFLTRKAARIYNEVLFQDAKMNEDGRVEASPKQIDRATQALIVNSIKSAIRTEESKDDEGKIIVKQFVIEVTDEWLDTLSDADYKRIDSAVYELKKASDESVKKL